MKNLALLIDTNIVLDWRVKALLPEDFLKSAAV